MHIQSNSQFAHLYLGYPHNPTPVFRDLNPEAHDWPEGAVFAVTVSRDELVFPEHWPFPDQDSATEFIAEDGWPVGFPEDKKQGYFKTPNGFSPDFYRSLFHNGTPYPWRRWTEEEWGKLRQNYQWSGGIYTETKRERRARGGAMAGLIRGLEPVLPKS